MPGIDFRELRARISIKQVLELAGFEVVARSGDQVRGLCPIHGSTTPRSRSFSANLRKNTFQCFGCKASGNQLDLWVAITHLPLAAAAEDLCSRLSVEVPLIRKTVSCSPLQTEKRNP